MEKVLIGALRAMREEDENASFNVIVVDSSPLYEGKLATLSSEGLAEMLLCFRPNAAQGPRRF